MIGTALILWWRYKMEQMVQAIQEIIMAGIARALQKPETREKMVELVVIEVDKVVDELITPPAA